MKINKLKTQWFNSVDQGRRLEIVAVDSEGIQLNNVTYPLLSILADEKDESLQVEMYTEDGIVQIPLTELQHAIALAPGEVHSEA